MPGITPIPGILPLFSRLSAFKHRLAHSPLAVRSINLTVQTSSGRSQTAFSLPTGHREGRRVCFRLLRDPREGLTAYAECYMAFVYHFTVLILAQNDTGHMVILADVAANNKIIIFQIFYLNPVLCSFVLDVNAILSFGYNASKSCFSARW